MILGLSGKKKGQGSTEYLVLLAMVLVVAMVAIALLGFFPGLAGDTRAAQSDSYWRGTARPFAIHGHVLNQSGSVMLLQVQNLDSSTKYITSIALDGLGVVASNAAVNTYLTPGQQTTLSTTVTSGSCVRGVAYEFNVSINYNTVGGISGSTQRGTKSLIGVCG